MKKQKYTHVPPVKYTETAKKQYETADRLWERNVKSSRIISHPNLRQVTEDGEK